LAAHRPWRLSSKPGDAGEFAILGDGRILFRKNLDLAATLEEISPATMASGTARQVQRWDGIFPYRLSASADGKHSVVLRRSSDVSMFVARLEGDGKRIEQVRKLKVSGSNNTLHAWTPDGGAILFESIWDGAYRIFEQQLDKPDTQVMRVAQS